MDAAGDVPVEVAVDVGAEHAEGPIWDSRTARLWWVDITGQAVHCSDPVTGSDTAWRTPWQPGGIVLDVQGRPVVAAPDGLAVLDPDTGRTTLRVAVVEQNKPENRANDVTIDSHGRCWPDGMTLDADGMLWVACGRAGAVHRYRPDGILDAVVAVPTSNPTSVAFGGADGGDLYITTSCFHLEPAERAAQPLAGAIFTCRPGVTGAPAPRYGVTPSG